MIPDQNVSYTHVSVRDHEKACLAGRNGDPSRRSRNTRTTGPPDGAGRKSLESGDDLPASRRRSLAWSRVADALARQGRAPRIQGETVTSPATDAIGVPDLPEYGPVPEVTFSDSYTLEVGGVRCPGHRAGLPVDAPHRDLHQDHDVRDHAVDPPRPRPQRPGPCVTATHQGDPVLVRPWTRITHETAWSDGGRIDDDLRHAEAEFHPLPQRNCLDGSVVHVGDPAHDREAEA